AHGIETLRLSPKMFATEEEYGSAGMGMLAARAIEMIVLAGFMRKLPEAVVDAYASRILNVHPALLPKFGGRGMYGRHVHEAVLAAGETESGVTVHLVDREYDTGPAVAQARVPVLPDDTPETLAARVLAMEHTLYPEVIIDQARTLLAGRVPQV
ncbi:MAG: phosphoribosylglycinamide formyltransferase, partial [Bacteroidota bacterium]